MEIPGPRPATGGAEQMHPTFILQPLVGALRTQAFLDLGGLCEAVSSGVQLLLFDGQGSFIAPRSLGRGKAM
jgi:hypothetical protein